MVGLGEKIFEQAKKNSTGLVREQYCTVEHAGVGTEMGLGGLIEDWRGLVGVQVQLAGEWGGIWRLQPSQNGWVQVSNRAVRGLRGVGQEMAAVKW